MSLDSVTSTWWGVVTGCHVRGTLAKITTRLLVCRGEHPVKREVWDSWRLREKSSGLQDFVSTHLFGPLPSAKTGGLDVKPHLGQSACHAKPLVSPCIYCFLDTENSTHISSAPNNKWTNLSVYDLQIPRFVVFFPLEDKDSLWRSGTKKAVARAKLCQKDTN
jgi:hypothetical protein